jgi:hypothetical protein
MRYHALSLWRRYDMRLLTLSAVFFTSACATTAPPVRTSPPKPFLKSPPPGRLGASCVTLEVAGCSALDAMKGDTAAFHKTHAAQMKVLEGQLQSIARMLSRPEAVPTASIAAYSPDTTAWNDPDGIYPATMVVRFEYERGLNRLGKNVEFDLKQALEALSVSSQAASRDWQELVKGARTTIPDAIAAARTAALVSVQFVDKTFAFSIPAALAERYLRRDALPWEALVSHVITEGKLKHKRVKEHRLQIAPALTVVQQANPRGLAVTITESPAQRDRKTLQSQVPVGDFCKKLRGELRFVPRDQKLSMKAVFRSAADKGGSR